jgi:hypothetical protein
MEVDRPPTVSVVVVADHGEAQLIDTLLRDDNTTIGRWHWPSDPADAVARWDRPDVVIFGGAAADQTPPRIRYLRHRWPTTLADFVWGDAEGDGEARRGVVEVYMGYLRRKLSASRSVMIRTVRGVGYRFDPRN